MALPGRLEQSLAYPELLVLQSQQIDAGHDDVPSNQGRVDRSIQAEEARDGV